MKTTKLERLRRQLRALFDSEEEYQAHCRRPLWQRIGFTDKAAWDAYRWQQLARLWQAAVKALRTEAQSHG